MKKERALKLHMGKLSSTNERKYLLLALRKTVDLLRGFLSGEYLDRALCL